MPTRLMIDCLVYNVFYQTESHAGDWQALVLETLTKISHTTQHDQTALTMVQLDGRTRLFPNAELFDEQDAHRFTQTLLAHLAEQLG